MPSNKIRRELDPDRDPDGDPDRNPDGDSDRNPDGDLDRELDRKKPELDNGSSSRLNLMSKLILIIIVFGVLGLFYYLFKELSPETSSKPPILIPKTEELPSGTSSKPPILIPKLEELPSYISSVNHYMAIDYSESANNDDAFRSLRQQFCQMAVKQYQVEDHQSVFTFASTQQLEQEKDINSDLLEQDKLLCPSLSESVLSKSESGTSLIDLLQFLLGWISSKTNNSSNNDKPTIITVLIQHEEPGANLGNTRYPDDIKRLVQILSQLQNKSVTVVILSPVDSLILRLQESVVPYLDNTRICSTANLNQCIKEEFKTARTKF